MGRVSVRRTAKLSSATNSSKKAKGTTENVRRNLFSNSLQHFRRVHRRRLEDPSMADILQTTNDNL